MSNELQEWRAEQGRLRVEYESRPALEWKDAFWMRLTVEDVAWLKRLDEAFQ